MKSIFKIFFIVVCFSLASCNTNADGSWSFQPNSLDLTPPPGPPEYKKGWGDGCESGSNAYSNPFYKVARIFQYKYDTSLRNNKVYTQVWKDAFIYCSIYWERTNETNI
jgi:hypothetical protein